MSLGFPNASNSTREALRQTYEKALEAGVAIVTAVGNDGMLNLSFPVPNSVRVPGGCPPPWLHPDQQVNAGGLSACIAVGAVNSSNKVADFSSKGPFTWQTTSYADYPYLPGREIGLIRPDVCAPGVSIVSCSNTNSGGYASMDGTSQATPCVTGVICLMLQKKSHLTPAQICEALETTATKLSETKSNETGSGCVNALLALEEIDKYEDTTGINDNLMADFNVYPNPVKDRLYIETSTQIQSIEVYDVYGRLQVTKTPSHQGDLSVDVSDLNSGLYFVKVKTEEGNIVKRIIKN
jgi:subtilisin family serine protease